MKNNYTNIKVIGFDLDQTLYPKSTKIDAKIQEYIFEKISEHRQVSLEKAETLFAGLYKNGEGLSGRKTLIELGIPNASDIIQEALENADIASVLEPNPLVNSLLEQLKEKYKNIDIITGSNKKQTTKKLEALSIPEDLFTYIIADEDASKSDGKAYQLWMSYYNGLNPNEFLYVGDREGPDHEVPSSLGIKTVLVNVQEEKNDLKIPQLEKFQDIEILLS